ncbi:oligosaccharide flippase family protein [Mycobacteroides abscessus]|uniref:oligosaccharide flippase family protein n=1 Tax=Mycobacteroides abscessus TaxID=36809 RepID=UPI000241CD65|nr:oligosaccharide flippase family protein [Mycobacteroides abscessus]EHM22791.1 hypothetical protein MBOL_09100 [Mycobacteroides abscessus subsp. bolletii BD]ORA29391.1 hypothetical protein BST18_05890 [Mycobacteroides abscessus subsp. bolletii]TPF65571.1 membrane protein [Mycobacteroides abscessus subsp. bolletii]BBB40396.1 succinoglycan biosynthesis transporter [Mycobacteroides abscessus subsp. bolletii BD]
MTSGDSNPAEASRQAESDQPGKAIRNTASLLVSRIAIAAMGWAGTMLIARTLPATEWGQFSFVFGLLGTMSIFTDLGVGRVVLARLHDDDRAEASRVAMSFIALRVVLGAVGYLVAVLFVVLSGYPEQVVIATAVAGIVVVVATPSHALTVLYQSQLKLTRVAVAETFGQMAQLLFTIAAVLFAPYLIVFVVPAVINEVVSIAVKLRGVHDGSVDPRPAGPVQLWRWKEMLREAAPLSLGLLFVEVAWRIGILILGHVDTFDAVGLFAIGYKFADLMLLAAVAVISPFTTLMVVGWPNPERFRSALHRATAIIAVMCAVGLAAFWPVADDLLGLLYGHRFEAAAFSTRLLVAAAAVSALAHLGMTALISAGHHRLYPWVAMAALGANVGTAAVLIPRSSFEGAAWATLAGEVVLLVGIAVVLRVSLHITDVLPLQSVLGPTVIAVLVAAAGSLAPGLSTLPWPVRATTCGLVAFVSAHMLGLTAGLQLAPVLRKVVRRS